MKHFFIIAIMALAQNSFASESSPILYQPNPDSPIEQRNDKANKALDQFAFLIGDWDVSITWKAQNKEAITYQAKWHNHWIIDGHAVMQEWRGPYLTGMEVRYYNPKTKQWSGKNLYVNGDWKDVVAEWKNGEMIVRILDAEDKTGKFINRETYYGIKKDSFKMKSERSYDNGQTWVDGNYSMAVVRSQNN